ncbi:hypothetical protein CTEN210_05073 [Chaetoceros tenuissimus]|uniref:UBX domain-containing protein n=1 Tax=Chaetoceros tenuissimus TaxID=426638 RepID=A0AAD3CM56_9STRA|nr:hypothetical protein CTEN210_05073 [Chaetoceros tenuissimus]
MSTRIRASVQVNSLLLVAVMLIFSSLSSNAVVAFKLNLESNIGKLEYPTKQKTYINSLKVQSGLLDIRGGGGKKATEELSSKLESSKESSEFSLVSLVFSPILAISRALGAGIDAMWDEEPSNPVSRMFHVFSSMIKASFDKHYESDKSSRSKDNFEEFLCKAYGIELDDEETVNIHAGSLTDAMQSARSEARLLVVFIPSSKPRKAASDALAIESIVSSEVNKVAEHQARKKEDGGSFAFWSTKYDSNEASVAMKRLKVKKTSTKAPVLMVVYPQLSANSSGQAKIVPRVLAQHHCNPPPDSESMAKWLNALRKRHAKQYANMQLERKELALFKERKEGFKASLEDDKRREQEEAMEAKRKAEEEARKKEHEEMIKKRRVTLLESLPEEPAAGSSDVVIIALRFTDGTTGKRRFESETEVGQIFNWIDAMFKVERENVNLMIMNGQQTFDYGEDKDITLRDAGFGKMLALRVIEKSDDDDDNDDDDDESSDEESEEE